MPTRTGVLFMFAFAAAIAIVAFVSGSIVEGYPYKSNMATAAAGTVTALIAISLFVERGMAVVNALLFGDAQRTAEVKLMETGNEGIADLSRLLTQRSG